MQECELALKGVQWIISGYGHASLDSVIAGWILTAQQLSTLESPIKGQFVTKLISYYHLY